MDCLSLNFFYHADFGFIHCQMEYWWKQFIFLLLVVMSFWVPINPELYVLSTVNCLDFEELYFRFQFLVIIAHPFMNITLENI